MAKDIIISEGKEKLSLTPMIILAPITQGSHRQPIRFKNEALISVVISSQAMVKLGRYLQKKERESGALSIRTSPTDMFAVEILKAIRQEKSHLSILATNLGFPID